MGIAFKRLMLRITLFAGVFLLILAGLTLLMVGPWPSYADSSYAEQDYHQRNLTRMDASLSRSKQDPAPPRLMMGWAERDITPPVGTPLGGYSARPNEKRNSGVHDPVFVRAIVLHDGTDTVALVGTDLLMVSLNLAQLVWEGLATGSPFTQDNILFTASHTHCGPGAFAPGVVAEYSLGKYDPAIERQIADAITQAVLEAHTGMSPGKLAHAQVFAPEYIKNRTNVEGKDASLNFMLLEKDTGEKCYALRYSAHPTNLPETFMQVSAAYPGALCQNIRERTGAMAVFLGGAVGAMGPDTPQKLDSPASQMQAMGKALADKVLAYDAPLEFKDRLDIRSLGAELEMPPMQARPAPEYANWRFSPFFANLVGIPKEGWIQAVQVGDLLFLGLPYDSGGALSEKWMAEFASAGVDLWVSGHCVAYCGYLSPDEYYTRPPQGYDQWYEWYLMNWFGPNQEAMFTDLKNHILKQMKG